MNDEVTINDLNNEELVELYEKILAHIDFLNNSIIKEEEGENNEAN